MRLSLLTPITFHTSRRVATQRSLLGRALLLLSIVIGIYAASRFAMTTRWR